MRKKKRVYTQHFHEIRIKSVRTQHDTNEFAGSQRKSRHRLRHTQSRSCYIVIHYRLFGKLRSKTHAHFHSNYIHADASVWVVGGMFAASISIAAVDLVCSAVTANE